MIKEQCKHFEFYQTPPLVQNKSTFLRNILIAHISNTRSKFIYATKYATKVPMYPVCTTIQFTRANEVNSRLIFLLKGRKVVLIVK